MNSLTSEVGYVKASNNATSRKLLFSLAHFDDLDETVEIGCPSTRPFKSSPQAVINKSILLFNKPISVTVQHSTKGDFHENKKKKS